MNKKEIYKIWAPYNSRWTNWVRPVPFIGIDKTKRIGHFIDYSIPQITYIKCLKRDTAIIIDEPGGESVKESIGLAKLGFRPIPIFNGTNPNENTQSIIDNDMIEQLLIWGAYELTKIKLDKDAPPVFLLDSNRLNRYKVNRFIFDNSWDVYSQDLPTYEKFKSNGIMNIIVKGSKLNKDLTKVLYKHQKNGINIWYTSGYEEPILIKLKKVKYEL